MDLKSLRRRKMHVHIGPRCDLFSWLKRIIWLDKLFRWCNEPIALKTLHNTLNGLPEISSSTKLSRSWLIGAFYTFYSGNVDLSSRSWAIVLSNRRLLLHFGGNHGAEVPPPLPSFSTLPRFFCKPNDLWTIDNCFPVLRWGATLPTIYHLCTTFIPRYLGPFCNKQFSFF